MSEFHSGAVTCGSRPKAPPCSGVQFPVLKEQESPEVTIRTTTLTEQGWSSTSPPSDLRPRRVEDSDKKTPSSNTRRHDQPSTGSLHHSDNVDQFTCTAANSEFLKHPTVVKRGDRRTPSATTSRTVQLLVSAANKLQPGGTSASSAGGVEGRRKSSLLRASTGLMVPTNSANLEE